MIDLTDPPRADRVSVHASPVVAGATIARHQLALAMAIGCERVICLARQVTGEVIALQHAAERHGARFHVVSSTGSLPGQVTALDEVMVLAPGLLADHEAAQALVAGGKAIAVMPVDMGLAAGFERIDLNDAWAGLLMVPGSLIDRLADLPDDCAAGSALVRIALQAGVPRREVPSALLADGGWRQVRDAGEAQAAEQEWMSAMLGDSGAPTLGGNVTGSLVRLAGPALLHAGYGSRSATIAAIAGLALSLVAGQLGWIAAALLLAGLTWVVGSGAIRIARIEQALGDRPGSTLSGLGWLLGLVDGLLVVLVTWAVSRANLAGWGNAAFAILVLLGLLRLLPCLSDRSWLAWSRDRLALCMVLAGASALGLLLPVIQALALAGLVTGLALTFRKGS